MQRWKVILSWILAALLLSTPATVATEQEEDAIRYEGKTAHLLERPLGLHLQTLSPRPRFDPPRSSNWKGYSADWEIRDSKLYLVAFEALSSRKPVPISDLFPKRELPILADWFTGTLHLLSAERERKVGGYPVFKHVTQMRVKNGVLSEKKEMENVSIVDLKAGDSPGQK